MQMLSLRLQVRMLLLLLLPWLPGMITILRLSRTQLQGLPYRAHFQSQKILILQTNQPAQRCELPSTQKKKDKSKSDIHQHTDRGAHYILDASSTGIYVNDQIRNCKPFRPRIRIKQAYLLHSNTVNILLFSETKS